MTVSCPEVEVGSTSYDRAMDYQLTDKRKPDPERCAAVIPIFGPYQPMVCFDDGARDGQPHAHALGLAGKERIEDFF